MQKKKKNSPTWLFWEMLWEQVKYRTRTQLSELFFSFFLLEQAVRQEALHCIQEMQLWYKKICLESKHITALITYI